MSHDLSQHCRRTLAAVLLCTLVIPSAACGRKGHAIAPMVGPADDAAPVRVTSVPAQAREVPQTLAVTGSLMPDQQSEVTPIVAGRVTEVLVERGAVVRAGDPLLRLRDVDFRSNAASAAAQLEQARARLGIEDDRAAARFDPEQLPDVRAARSNRDIAEDTLRRMEQLRAAGSVSELDLERARANAAAARAQYTSALNGARAAFFQYQAARVTVGQARRAVADSVVRAPFDGEIAERRANVGEYVSPQRAVVTLVRTDPLRLEIQIPQESIPYVQRGQDVEIHVDAFPERTFHGTIQYISAAIRQDTRGLTAEALLPNTEHVLRPGMFVTGHLSLGRRQQLILVPSAAVLSESGTHRVFVVAGGRAHERVVAIVERRPEGVLLSRGVQQGERVAIDHIERLSDGARVEE